MDTTTYEVLARIETGPRPRAIAFDRDGSTAFVSSENGAALTVFDAATRTVTGTIPIPRTPGTPTPPRPLGLVLSPDGGRIFVSLGRAKSVTVDGVGPTEVARRACAAMEEPEFRRHILGGIQSVVRNAPPDQRRAYATSPADAPRKR